MAKLAQIGARFHQCRQPVAGSVRRAVIDVDDFVGPAAVERGRDFRDQGRYVLSLVAHRHNDRNGNGLGSGIRQIEARFEGVAAPLLWGGWPPGNPFAGLYGARPGGNMAPPWPIPKAMPLAANHVRTAMAPMMPNTAPAVTSLG